MNCDVCDSHLGKKESEFGGYRCDYYLVHSNRSNKHAYGVYRKNTYPDDVGSGYNVMLCSGCYIKNRNHIPIPVHIPEKQYKKWLSQRLKN